MNKNSASQMQNPLLSARNSMLAWEFALLRIAVVVDDLGLDLIVITVLKSAR